MKRLILLLCGISMLACTSVDNKVKTSSNKAGDYELLKGINSSYHSKDITKALNKYENSYKINPNNPILLREMAFLYAEIGDEEKSIDFYKKSLVFDSRNENALKNLAILYYQKNNFSEARKYLNNILNAKNDNFYNKFMAMTYIKENNNLEAYKYFSKVNLDEYDKDFLEIYTEVLKNLGQKSEIKNLYEKNYLKFKDNKEFIKDYSHIMYYEFSDIDKAETAILDYIINNARDVELLMILEAMYTKSGNISRAKDINSLINRK